jgi:DNA-binding transcriptional ArsR family regulator
VELLTTGSASVSQLATPLSVSLAAVVQHLQVLEKSGLVRTQKVGRVRACHLEREGLELAQRWLSERRVLWERRFDRLAELVEELPPKPRIARKKGKS